MLSYRHHFHAGNHADVLKHALLARLLLALHKKDTPFRYLDTHAGAGLYDLEHPWARKNAEFRDGVGRVWGRSDVPEGLRPWLDAVRAENPDGELRVYPGSPRLARRFLRPQDRMLLTELHPAEVEPLERLFAGDRQVTVERRDGWDALRAHLPPPQRRGLVLVDPAFDRAGELSRLAQALAQAHRRWATGVLAFWYPLMDSASMRAFAAEVVATGVRKVLQLELEVLREDRATLLRGSGLLVVNPPWRLDEEAAPLLAWLADALAQGPGSASTVRWLVPE